MKFFTDVTQVSFNFADKIFNVASVFCEFSLFGRDFSIKWYGVIIAFGFTLAVLFGGRMAWVWRIDLNKMVDVLIWGTFFGIIGARGYYVLSEWEYYIQNPREIFAIWHGGLAIYGGIIGGLLGAFIYCKKAKMNFYNLLDMIGMSLLIGQGIGRWGNYANQEAFGTNTDSIFGMHSEKVARYIISNQDFFAEHNIIMDPDKPVHPTFLYESVWCITGFIILYIILKTCRKFSGQMFLLYGIWYGTGRAIIEGMRTDSLYIWNTDIRVSQALSMSIVFLCLVLLIVKIVRYKKNPQPIEGVDFFPEGSRMPKKERNKVTD
ncbi:MAG TPA: prolipoprotein diacylglyceryl transferase [Clostridiales bacterium]|nr:prolipoprotein diacylglyceryl transferase [Clostridiales bacterium]